MVKAGTFIKNKHQMKVKFRPEFHENTSKKTILCYHGDDISHS